MSSWRDLGFRDNPYSTKPLEPSEQGDRALAGREAEVALLERLITTTTLIPTVEGPNGVGKTSLISVAGYRLRQTFDRTAYPHPPLYVFMPDPFQLSIGGHVAFEEAVYLRLARALIDLKLELLDLGRDIGPTGEVETWLDTAVAHGRTAGATVLGFGATYGASTTFNAGFDSTGLKQRVDGWLGIAFPNADAGAFIAVLDNLEILQSSNNAREGLDYIRDGVLSMPGVRWILSGSQGIVRSLLASPRLQGRLSTPIEVGPLDPVAAGQVIELRVGLFAVGSSAVPPVDATAFTILHSLVRGDLRTALAMCQEFVVSGAFDWIPATPAERRRLFMGFLRQIGEGLVRGAVAIDTRGWQVLRGVVDRGGSMSPSEYTTLAGASVRVIRDRVGRLEQAGFLVTVADEHDLRRRTIQVTARGFIADAANAGGSLQDAHI